MDAKNVLILALGILAGLYVIQETVVGDKLNEMVPPKQGFQPMGDDAATALTLAVVATGVGLIVNKYA